MRMIVKTILHLITKNCRNSPMQLVTTTHQIWFSFSAHNVTDDTDDDDDNLLTSLSSLLSNPIVYIYSKIIPAM